MRGRTFLSKVIRAAWLAVLAALICGTLAASAQTLTKSGYALGPAQCGDGASAFPRIKIDMKAGFCAAAGWREPVENGTRLCQAA